MEMTDGNESADKLTALCQCIKHSQSWVPRIVLKSTHFSNVISEHDVERIHAMPDNIEPYDVNLSLFLDVSKADTPALSIYRSHVLGYPPNAVLELQSFQGLEAERSVITALKEAAAGGGTVLVVESVGKSKSQFRLKEIFFVCDHYRLSHGEQKEFEGKHQIPGSKKQSEHRRSKNDDTLDGPLLGDGSSSDASSNPQRKTTSVRPTCATELCTFSFTAFCSAVPGCEGKWCIASSTKKKKKDTCFMHINHLPINSVHLRQNVSAIPESLIEEIKLKVRSGVTPMAIVNEIRNKNQITISLQQVYKIKQEIVDDLIRNAGDKPSYSAAERLIQVFKTYNDVSYIYVKHDICSGFVTYTKSRGTLQEESQIQCNDSDQAATSIEIESWRKELKLGENNQILVAFAWSHTEESRKFCMFPEFLALDLTFGVNRQKRPLLVISGVDGHNKSFTAFRCFMPAKTKIAYKWAIHSALPFVVGQKAVDLVQCITSDNEEAIGQAIEESKQHIGGLPAKVRHRLDFYHLFIQVWNQKCNAPSNASPILRSALNIIKDWVYSWVFDVESEAEFKYSVAKYDVFFHNVKHTLGDKLAEEVQLAVGRVLSNIEKVGAHKEFQRVATMGYVGSSIVEGTNVGIKRGGLAAKASMNIDVAGNQMLQQVYHHSHRRSISSAQGIHRHKHWSCSLTKNFLTSYQEGLASKNFDSRDSYVSIKAGSSNCWYVTSKRSIRDFHDDNNDDTEVKEQVIPSFYCVRTVRISSDGFITCTCPYTYQCLAPCRHIMVVLNDSIYLLPQLFHIRWWESFNYFYLTEFGSGMVPQLHNSLNDAYIDINTNHYTSDQIYKGCFLSNALSSTGYPTCDEKVNNLICHMVNYISMTDHNKVIEIGSKAFKDYLNYNQRTNNDSTSQLFDLDDQAQLEEGTISMTGFGGLSDTVAVLSPHRLVPQNMHNIPSLPVNINDTEDYHLFMSMREAAKTPAQKIKMRLIMSQACNEFLAENRSGSIQNTEITFLGEDGSGGHRSGKRHKQIHERWSNNKSL